MARQRAAGFLGTEVLAEGPLNREKRSSLLVNYRYSTAVIFSALGIDIGTDAVPKYQDGSFKLHMPTSGGGAFSLWGMGGNSNVDILISEQLRPERNIYGDNDRDQYFKSAMGIVGATYTKPVNERTYVKTTLALSQDRQDSYHEFVTRDLTVQDGDTLFTNVNTEPLMAYVFDKRRVSLASHANRKLEVERGTASLRFGLNADAMFWTFQDSIKPFVWTPGPGGMDSTLTLGTLWASLGCGHDQPARPALCAGEVAPERALDGDGGTSRHGRHAKRGHVLGGAPRSGRNT